MKAAAPWLAAALALLVLPFVFSGGASLTMLSQMGIAAVFALSFNMLLGQTGLLSFGHAVYFGLGGLRRDPRAERDRRQQAADPHAVGAARRRAAGLVFGILFGSVSTQRAGTIFAMISLGMGELVAAARSCCPGSSAARRASPPTAPRRAASSGSTSARSCRSTTSSPRGLLCIGAMHAFMRTPLGRMCNAVRDNPERAEFVGYNTQHVRFFAFCTAGLFAGLAGGLAAINYEIVAAERRRRGASGTVLLMAYIGGVAYFIGPDRRRGPADAALQIR